MFLIADSPFLYHTVFSCSFSFSALLTADTNFYRKPRIEEIRRLPVIEFCCKIPGSFQNSCKCRPPFSDFSRIFRQNVWSVNHFGWLTNEKCQRRNPPAAPRRTSSTSPGSSWSAARRSWGPPRRLWSPFFQAARTWPATPGSRSWPERSLLARSTHERRRVKSDHTYITWSDKFQKNFTNFAGILEMLTFSTKQKYFMKFHPKSAPKNNGFDKKKWN